MTIKARIAKAEAMAPDRHQVLADQMMNTLRMWEVPTEEIQSVLDGEFKAPTFEAALQRLLAVPGVYEWGLDVRRKLALAEGQGVEVNPKHLSTAELTALMLADLVDLAKLRP